MRDDQPAFGDHVRALRQARGWSLREAAKQVGIAHSRLDEVEKMRDARTGKAFVPSYVIVVRIARAFDVAPDTLLRMVGHEPGLELDPPERELVGLFRGLDAAGRDRLIALARALTAGEMPDAAPPPTAPPA